MLAIFHGILYIDPIHGAEGAREHMLHAVATCPFPPSVFCSDDSTFFLLLFDLKVEAKEIRSMAYKRKLQTTEVCLSKPTEDMKEQKVSHLMAMR